MTEFKLIFFIASCIVSFYAGAVFNRPVVTHKEEANGRYHVTVRHYGKYLVNKDQYESLNLGDEIPSYLRGTGR
jgi:hypothetical protein|nr:MAG TPA: Protein of unknown function (DUF1372) [Caudoviricetes sp.]